MRLTTFLFASFFFLAACENTDYSRGPQTECHSGLTTCGSSCAALGVDNNNCGACGNKCPEKTFCSAGSCHCDEVGLNLCNNKCVSLKTDSENCGSCSNKCTNTQHCDVGNCK